MSLDLAFDDGQQAIADAVAGFCADRCDDDVVKGATGSLPRALWRDLAALGVLGVATPEGGGGALEVVAAVESLGRAVFPGPVAATFLATWVLDEPLRGRVAAGEALVAAGATPLLPWAPEAEVFLEIDGERVFRGTPKARPTSEATLGGEPWGRVELLRREALPRGPAGLVLHRLVQAAQLAALGARLVEDASRHAAVRKQFGRPIGDFQAVAHPLADASMRLEAAATLARAAAFHFDAGPPRDARRFSLAAHASACEAALAAAYVCHQVFGAVGITLEGPVFHVSRRIRQLASQAPGPAVSRAMLLADAGFGARPAAGARP